MYRIVVTGKLSTDHEVGLRRHIHIAVKKAQEKKFEFSEIRMQRWMCVWSYKAYVTG